MNRNQIADMCNEMKALGEAHREEYSVNHVAGTAGAIDEKAEKETVTSFLDLLTSMLRDGDLFGD